MASKYIHNISGIEKTYLGVPIADSAFYQIPDNMLIKFQNDSSVMGDIISGIIRVSSDGLTDYSTVNTINFNFLRNEHYEVDAQGRQITRVAAGQAGWVYFAHPVEFETSKLNSLVENTSSNVSRNISTIKLYDINDVEITTVENEINVVKTVITFKPSYDYELVAGSLQQIASPDSDIRIWVSGGILELGGAYVREFTGGINMRYYSPNESLKTDGRAAKYMKKDIVGVPYQANQMQVIVRHNAGVQHKLMLILEYFRA